MQDTDTGCLLLEVSLRREGSQRLRSVLSLLWCFRFGSRQVSAGPRDLRPCPTCLCSLPTGTLGLVSSA